MVFLCDLSECPSPVTAWPDAIVCRETSSIPMGMHQSRVILTLGFGYRTLASIAA